MEEKIFGMGVAKDPAGHNPRVNVERVRHQAVDLRLIKKDIPFSSHLHS